MFKLNFKIFFLNSVLQMIPNYYYYMKHFTFKHIQILHKISAVNLDFFPSNLAIFKGQLQEELKNS